MPKPVQNPKAEEKKMLLIISRNQILKKSLMSGSLSRQYYLLFTTGVKIALKYLRNNNPQAVILDVGTRGFDSALFMKEAPARNSSIEILLLAEPASRKKAIECFNRGAFNIIPSPWDTEQIAINVKRAVEKRQSAISLKESEARIESLLKLSPDPIVILQNKKIRLANRKFFELSGYNQKELDRGLPFLKLVPAKDRNILLQRHMDRLEGASISTSYYASDFIIKDGSILPCELSATMISYEGRPAVLVATRDISERRHSEELIRIQRDLAVTLSSTLTLDEALEHILSQTLKLREIDCGGIYLVNEPEKSLILRNHKGLKKRFIDATSRYAPDSPQARLVMTGNAVYRTQKEINRQKDKIRQAEKLRFEAILPIKSRDKVVASINLASHLFDEFPEDTRHALEAIAALVGGVLARIKIEEDLRLTHFSIDRSSEPIFWIKPDLTFVYANRAACDSLGYSLNELLKMKVPDIYKSFTGLQTKKAWNSMKKAGALTIESQLIRKDGSSFPVEITNNVIEFEGREYNCAFARNISERKQSEDRTRKSLKEKEVLLREVHHRVKNNLQIISSLINLQSKKISNPADMEVFKDSRNRIRAMALIHEILYKSKNLGYIDFYDYVHHLVTNLFNAFGAMDGRIRFFTDIRKTTLSIDKIVPIGLIINELVSNSLKHAFPEHRKGEIEIQIQPVAKNKMKMEIADNGIGFPKELNFKKTGTLGLHLVTMLSENQLQGNLRITSKKGTTFRIVFPAS